MYIKVYSCRFKTGEGGNPHFLIIILILLTFTLLYLNHEQFLQCILRTLRVIMTFQDILDFIKVQGLNVLRGSFPSIISGARWLDSELKLQEVVTIRFIKSPKLW